MGKLFVNILMTIAYIWSSNCSFAQNCNDSYNITNEFNAREFISRNQIINYTIKSKSDYSTYCKSVKFNSWFAIESVRETEVYKRKSPEVMDSLVVEYHFVYDYSSAKPIQIVIDVLECYPTSFPNTIDTIFIEYKNGKIANYTSHKYWISGQTESHPVIKNRIEKSTIDSIIYSENDFISSYRKKQFSNDFETSTIINTVPSSPVRIDSILNIDVDNHLNVCYNEEGKVILESDIMESRSFIYNKYGQLVVVVKTSNRETLNPGTDREVSALPNASIDRYIYDNNSYLLDKIITSTGQTFKYSYWFKE